MPGTVLLSASAALARHCATHRPVRIVNVASEAHKMGAVNFNDLFRDKPGAPLTTGFTWQHRPLGE